MNKLEAIKKGRRYGLWMSRSILTWGLEVVCKRPLNWGWVAYSGPEFAWVAVSPCTSWGLSFFISKTWALILKFWCLSFSHRLQESWWQNTLRKPWKLQWTNNILQKVEEELLAQNSQIYFCKATHFHPLAEMETCPRSDTWLKSSILLLPERQNKEHCKPWISVCIQLLFVSLESQR